MDYSRNFFFINSDEQVKIKNARILLGGVGLGSVIAETALRLGFENLILIDGDIVEESNLNRQNYTYLDIGKKKVDALKERLLAINPEAQITTYDVFLNEDNVREYVRDCDIAINAIDFGSNAPFIFDDACIEQSIPVIHPYNLGWWVVVFVVNNQSKKMEWISDTKNNFEFNVVGYFINRSKAKYNLEWYEDILEKYIDQSKLDSSISPSQLSLGSSLLASIVTQILYAIVNNHRVKYLPEIYTDSTKV